MSNKISVLLSIINDILEEKGYKAISEMNSNLNLRTDLDFDSMDLAVLTARIEDVYKVDVFEDGIINMTDEILRKLG